MKVQKHLPELRTAKYPEFPKELTFIHAEELFVVVIVIVIAGGRGSRRAHAPAAPPPPPRMSVETPPPQAAANTESWIDSNATSAFMPEIRRLTGGPAW